MIRKIKNTLCILIISTMVSFGSYGKDIKEQTMTKTILENTLYGMGTGFLLGALTFLVDDSATSSKDFFSYIAMGGLIGAGVGGIVFTAIDLTVSGYLSKQQSLSHAKQNSPHIYAFRNQRKNSNYLLGLRLSLGLN